MCLSDQLRRSGPDIDEPLPSARGKIWKLMERLSTGGLRDKYNIPVVPPIPALLEGLHPTLLMILTHQHHTASVGGHCLGKLHLGIVI